MSLFQHTPYGEHEETDDDDADDNVCGIHEFTSRQSLLDKILLRRRAEDRHKHADNRQNRHNLPEPE